MNYADYEKSDLERIKAYLKEGKVDLAINLIASCIVMVAVSGGDKSEYYYLLGNAYRMKGEFHMAMKYYNLAIDENPDTPAIEARRALQGIMNFYNKDMYNH